MNWILNIDNPLNPDFYGELFYHVVTEKSNVSGRVSEIKVNKMKMLYDYGSQKLYVYLFTFT